MTSNSESKITTEVVTGDLRALLHWATVGVEQSVGGSYQHDIEHILESYSAHLGIKRSPRFQDVAMKATTNPFGEMKSDEKAAFAWFTDNGYAPPLLSEIQDLLWRIYGSKNHD